MKTLTRQNIIRALKTEPLQRRAWFHASQCADTSVLKECPVCAVGAVMRKCLNIMNSNKAIELTQGVACYTSEIKADGITKTEYIQGLLENKNYLGALSVLFESQSKAENSRVTANNRKELIAFVKNNFPKTIRVAA